MEHQAFAQLLGNYGEFFGSIAVVVTLVYLAGQLRQNTRALRASAYESFANLGCGINDFGARHADEILTVVQGGLDEFEGRLASGTMTREDIVYINFAHRHFRLLEATHSHHREGTLGGDVFEARVQGFARVFRDQPGIAMVWKHGQDLGYADDFRRFVDTHVVATGQ